jgi:natural product precursor
MKKLKLNKLSDHLFDEKQMNSVKGGAAPGEGPCGCCCACAYANNGGSSTADNLAANEAGGLYSDPGCFRDVVIYDK